MKKIYYLYIALSVVTAMVLYSCVKDYLDDHKGKASSEILSVDEAKAFFEKQMTEYATRAAGNAEHKPTIVPDEFTPVWTRGVSVSQDGVGSVNVPIMSNCRYSAIRSYADKQGKPKAYSAPVWQKLVVVKNSADDRMGVYILNLLPDEGFYKSNKNYSTDNFVNGGSKGRFSGLAIYSNLGGKILRIDKYSDGKEVAGANILVDKDKLDWNQEQIDSVLSNIYFSRKTVESTRGFSFEDENEIDDLEIIGHLLEEGNECPICGCDPCICSDICPICGCDPCMCQDLPPLVIPGSSGGGGGFSGGSFGGGGGGTGGPGGTGEEKPPIVMPDLTIPATYVVGKGTPYPYTLTNWNIFMPWDQTVNVTITGTPLTYSQQVQQLLKKLLEDCLSKQLFNYLNSIQHAVSIISVDNLMVYGQPANGVFGYHSNGSLILLDSKASQVTLLEELYHAYQWLRPGADIAGYNNQYGGNIEIEAKMAKYQYMVRNGIPIENYFGSTGNTWNRFISQPDASNFLTIWSLLTDSRDNGGFGYDRNLFKTTGFSGFVQPTLNINCNN